MNLLQFYTELLASVDITDIAGEGMLSALYNGAENPVTVGGKRLVLPTSEILRAGNWEARTAFHPLCEKINRTESAVLKLLKDVISLRIDNTYCAIAKSLMHTAASPELHKKMGGPKAASYLKNVPNVTEKTYKVLCKILDATKKPEYRLVNFYLKHGAVGDTGASRTCVVSFPIYDDLEDDEVGTVFGVKCDAKEKKNIIALLNYIFGDAETRELYTYGSTNPEAPYFHSLINSFYKLASRSNVLVETHKKYMEDTDALMIPLDWAESLDSFALFRGMIPSLDGNEGAVIVAADTQARAFNRPGVAEVAAAKQAAKEPLPWEAASSRPAPGDVASRRDTSQSSDPMEAFRNQFQRPVEETQADRWGTRREEPSRSGWSDRGRNSRDDRDDRGGRNSRSSYRDGGGSSRRHI